MSVRLSPDPTVITVGLGGLKKRPTKVEVLYCKRERTDRIDISLTLLICRSSFVRDTYNRGIEVVNPPTPVVYFKRFEPSGRRSYHGEFSSRIGGGELNSTVPT